MEILNMRIKDYCRLIFCCCLLTAISCNNEKEKYTDWKVAGGSKLNTRYAALNQVDTNNVTELTVAWIYHTGDADTANHSQIQCNPVIVDGVLYGTSPQLKLIALDAATGKLRWQFDPRDSTQNNRWRGKALNINRGVTYWEEGQDKRILYSVGSVIFAVNALTGKLIEGFGEQGGVDLLIGLGREVGHLYVMPTSPGIIYKNLYIVGGRTNESLPAAPGHIRAFDVKTGKQQWIFHTIPHPGEFGYDTWKDTAAYHFAGAANNWSGFSLDEKRGILFAPTGSAAFDFYGGNRIGNNLFANCLLALDALTGKRLWHFQTIHHDVWDRDLPTPPALVTVTHNGKETDAVAQPTKHGFVFLFERETGKPLFPIEERAVPAQSDLAGEELSPTQPVPLLPEPFARQTLTVADLNDLVPDSSYQDIKNKLQGYLTGNMFNPPSKQGTVIFPGFDGGAEWGGPAFDRETGLLYINSNEMPWILTMTDAEQSANKPETYAKAGLRLYKQHCMSCHGPEKKGAGNYPSITGMDKKYTISQLHELLASGRRMMPSFKQLTPEEKNAIAAFVLEQKKEQLKTFIPLALKANSNEAVPYSFTGYNKFVTKEGYPAIKPPWGTLNAINLNTGKLEWKIALGEFAELKAKGIPATGTENYGGAVVTSGGLLFIAATLDGKFRAINKRTGKILWETDLPAPGYATPAVYAINGKQYIVIACGGGKLNTKSGDAYVAFALPDLLDK